VQSLLESKYKKKFSGNFYGGFWGVFETFEEAIQAAPKSKPLGYDDFELANEYKNKLPQTIQSYDYPIIFWLREIFNDNSTVFDFGGNVGIHFFLYEKYIKYPPYLQWTVCDVPAITKTGEELALQMKKELKFTNNFEAANDNDILIASGSLQYVVNFAGELSKLPNKPKHLLINRLPLYSGNQFVTLQNGGRVFYPQFVFNKEEFIDCLVEIGYELVDIWKDRTDRCWIPFPEEKSIPFYTGLYLKLTI
jgi:putative methyltransferase (TIGR04325 family)